MEDDSVLLEVEYMYRMKRGESKGDFSMSREKNLLYTSVILRKVFKAREPDRGH